MTLQELIDSLQALPRSARTATVTAEFAEDCAIETAVDGISDVRYEHGEVVIVTDSADRFGVDDEEDEQ